LISSLRGRGPLRYQEAINAFAISIGQTADGLATLPEEEVDWALADYVVGLYEKEGGLSGLGLAGTTVAAMSKTHPRHHYRTAWKCLDVWRVKRPPQQAPAIPRRMLDAAVAWLVIAGYSHVAFAMVLCFYGLLRASEALTMTVESLTFVSQGVVLFLGQTKRGLEDKVVIGNPWAVAWIKQFVGKHRTMLAPLDRIVGCSYNTMQRWMRRAFQALGFEGDDWTSHGLRRGGATDLYMSGMPLTDLMLFGRWLAPRSCREYLRKGEVALRGLKYTTVQEHALEKFGKLGTLVWSAD
jgi:hypothetical protein